MEMGHDLKEWKKKEWNEREKRKLLGEDMPLTEGKQAQREKRIVNLFAEDKKIEVRWKSIYGVRRIYMFCLPSQKIDRLTCLVIFMMKVIRQSVYICENDTAKKEKNETNKKEN